MQQTSFEPDDRNNGEHDKHDCRQDSEEEQPTGDAAGDEWVPWMGQIPTEKPPRMHVRDGKAEQVALGLAEQEAAEKLAARREAERLAASKSAEEETARQTHKDEIRRLARQQADALKIYGGAYHDFFEGQRT